MPIPLGILAAAGFQPPTVASSYELIETITVGAGGASSVTFSNLNAYNTTYQHLQIRYAARTATTAGERSVVYLRLNSDESNNYSRHVFFSSDGAGSTVSVGNADQNYLEAPPAPSALCASGVFGSAVIDLLDPYETTKFKTSRALGGFMNSASAFYHKVLFSSSNWRSTAAVTTIKIDTPGTSWVQGSRFSIYGLKAS